MFDSWQQTTRVGPGRNLTATMIKMVVISGVTSIFVQSAMVTPLLGKHEATPLFLTSGITSLYLKPCMVTLFLWNLIGLPPLYAIRCDYAPLYGLVWLRFFSGNTEPSPFFEPLNYDFFFPEILFGYASSWYFLLVLTGMVTPLFVKYPS